MVGADRPAKGPISAKEPSLDERSIACTVVTELSTELDLQLSGNRLNHALELMLDGIIVARRPWWLAFAQIRGNQLRDYV